MSGFAAKFKLIFLPFVLIAVCTIGFYTFLNWLLIIKLRSLIIDKDFIEFFIPAGLVFIPILIWLRPRIKKLLVLKSNGRSDQLTGFIIFAWVATAAPMVITQTYMATATGKLTRLDSISQINYTAATRYYTVKHFYINKSMVHVKTIFAVSGKNRDFNMTIYGSVPVFNHIFPDTNKIAAIRNSTNVKTLVIINGILSNLVQLKKLPADSIRIMSYINPSFVMPKYGDAGKYGAIVVITKGHKMKIKLPFIKIAPVAWLGVKYDETINNNLSYPEKQERYKAFLARSDTDFRHRILDKFEYLDRLPYSKDLKSYTAAIKSKDDVIGGEPIILSPVCEAFADRNGNKLAWILGSFGIGAALFLIILQFVPLKNAVS